ncbi:helix-turn-helix domain-containing protein [Clostridium tetani]|uniref:helix-turn-helix domain-containing protein n=1 Tax=Clostridium tetani TaxID=1513 RepID=UPI0010284411|nr:helix-turn-helix domain-containing protein [Clostridium tetani]RXI70485.1 hypothetical protein DP127_09295 [Clostridium tetani]
MEITDVMDLAEASERYEININTLKTACQKGSKGLIKDIDYRKSGRVWLITKQAIERTWNKETNK